MEEEREKPNNFHTCDLCHYATRSVFLECEHTNSHQTPGAELFNCELKTPEKYECKCGFQSILKVNLNEHYQVVHKGKERRADFPAVLKSHQCKSRDFQTYSLLVFTNHVFNCKYRHFRRLKTVQGRASQDANWFKCEQCSYKGKTKWEMKSHVLHKHTSLEEIYWYKCDKCKYKSKTIGDLKRHTLRKHTSSEEIKWHQCEQCVYKSKTVKELELHVLRKHTSSEEINWQQCDNCKYKSKTIKEMKMHVLFKHTSSEEINWRQCAQCLFKSKTIGELKKHVLWKHTPSEEINWFECYHCPRKFKEKNKLQKHIQTKH